MPEFALSGEAQQRVGSPDFQQRLQKVRDTHWVNYTEVAEMKMSVLPLLFAEFKKRHLEKNTDRANAFLNFVEEGGDSLLHQATFDALHADLHAKDSQVWGLASVPGKLPSLRSSPAVQKYIEENQDSVHLYMYLQWIADTQINEAQAFGRREGHVRRSVPRFSSGRIGRRF